MDKLLIKILLVIGAIGFIIFGITGIREVFTGGSIMIPVDGLPPAEAKGAGGALFTFLYLCLGIGILKSLWNHSGNRDNICSRPGLLEEYPYCRWWRNEEDWYSEHNPMMKVTYPENHICPICKKKIEKYNEASEEKG